LLKFLYEMLFSSMVSINSSIDRYENIYNLNISQIHYNSVVVDD